MSMHNTKKFIKQKIPKIQCEILLNKHKKVN